MKKTIIILSHANKDSLPYVTYVHNHAKALVNNGYNVIVFAVYTYFPLVRKSAFQDCIKTIDGVQVIYKKRIGFSNLLHNSKYNLNGVSYYNSIKKNVKTIVKDNEVVLIDAHTFKVEGYAAYRLKKKYNIKTFVTLHGTSFNNSFGTVNGRKNIRKIGKIIDQYICVSSKIKRQLNLIDINNTKVIYNGINYFDVKRNNNNHNITVVASLISIKNIDLVIKSFVRICKLYPDSNLNIIGDGYQKDYLKNISNEKVKFWGKLDNSKVFDVLSKSNIFVLPSSPEGFGIAYVEAMYCGCVAIGTKNEGIDGFIQDGLNGFLVYIDEKEIYNKIKFIFENNIEKIRAKGIESASNMTWGNNALEYIKIL